MHNLTAIRDVESILERHVLDALTLLPALDVEGARAVIDVGAGAGFPGLVLAVARPALQVVLLEATRKKSAFSQDAIDQLHLKNVAALCARAESAAHDAAHRGRYCAAVARSVARMPVLAELALPFVRGGGTLLAQKSLDERRSEVVDAKPAFALLQARLEDVQYASLPGECQTERWDAPDEKGRRKAIVVVRKVGATPGRFPRRPGVPNKTPLR